MRSSVVPFYRHSSILGQVDATFFTSTETPMAAMSSYTTNRKIVLTYWKLPDDRGCFLVLQYFLFEKKQNSYFIKQFLALWQTKTNKTPAQAFTPPAEKQIGTKWALCTTAQAGNIKSGYLRILLYIAVVSCLVIGQLHVLDKCVYHAICR